ncbi:MAG: hypothetical protein AAF211_00430 [Myxococcota bacterium]
MEVEGAPVEESGAWAPHGVCDRVTAWAPKWAMPAMVALAACGAEPELPDADEVVQVYDARNGGWSEAAGDELEVGDTWLDDGRLHRWTDDGVQNRGEATVGDLAEADAPWTAEAATRVPGTDEWVLVLGEAAEAGHRKLGAVEAEERFAFQGRVFETADADGDGLIEVRPTGDVLGRVVNTFVRIVPEVIDADIEYADGSTDTLTGTPNHPFWVDAVRDYVPLGKLEVGTVLCAGRWRGHPRQQDVAAGRFRGLRLRGRGAAQLLRPWPGVGCGRCVGPQLDGEEAGFRLSRIRLAGQPDASTG